MGHSLLTNSVCLFLTTFGYSICAGDHALAKEGFNSLTGEKSTLILNSR